TSRPHGRRIVGSPVTDCGQSCPRSCGGAEGSLPSGVLLSEGVGLDTKSSQTGASPRHTLARLPRQRFSSILVSRAEDASYPEILSGALSCRAFYDAISLSAGLDLAAGDRQEL